MKITQLNGRYLRLLTISIVTACVALFIVLSKYESETLRPNHPTKSQILNDASWSLTGVSVMVNGLSLAGSEPNQYGIAAQYDYEEYYKDYVLGVDESAYSDYELETLLQLADAGDVHAMKAAAVKYTDLALSQEGEEDIMASLSKMRQLLASAVVYGDREVIDLIDQQYYDDAVFLLGQSTAEEKDRELIKAFAFYEFVGMRGNFNDRFQGQKSVSETYYPEKQS